MKPHHLKLAVLGALAVLAVSVSVNLKPADAAMSCACKLDAQGRVDVQASCTGVDWNDPQQGNVAVEFAGKCAAAAASKTMYFPKGAYAIDTCSAVYSGRALDQARAQAPAGSAYGVTAPGGTLRIVGAGMNDTVIFDRQPAKLPGGEAVTDGCFGFFVRFAPGATGEIRDLSLIGELQPGRRPGSYAVYGSGGWVKPDGSVQPTRINVTRVKAQHWARLFVGSGDTAQATEFTLDSSELHDIHQGIIISQEGYQTLPDGTYKRPYTPHQYVRILNSKFDHVGQRCTNQDHGMYIKAPFNELTVEGNTFLNSPGYAVHRYNGFFFTGDPRGVVNVKNNTFRQPDFEADPRARDLCDCKAGEPNCSVGPDGKDTRGNIYDSGYVLMDGPGGAHPQDYDVTITGNTFWGGNAISSQMPTTVTNNTFRAYPPLPGDSVPSQYPSTAVQFSQRGPSIFSDNKVDGMINVLEGADGTVIRDNTCIECSKEFDHGGAMLSVRGASDVSIENNTFIAGTGKFVVEPGEYVYENGQYVGRGTDHGTGLKITGNTFTARKGVTTPTLAIASGGNGVLTGNTFKTIEGGGAAMSIPSGSAWTVASNTVTAQPPVKPAFAGNHICTCTTDSQGRLNVKTACPNTDWNKVADANDAFATLGLCTQEQPIRELYFPAGTYTMASCALGSNVVKTKHGGNDLAIVGDGIDRTVIQDAYAAGDPNCQAGRHGGTMFAFGRGTKASFRDLTITEKAEPYPTAPWTTFQVPRATTVGVIYGALQKPDGTEVIGKLDVVRVKMHHLGAAFGTDNGGTEINVKDSQFSNFRHSVFSQIGDAERPKDPRQIFRVTGSRFEHIGAKCARGYPLYLHFPFREITVENNEFVNLHHLALSLFGGTAQPDCPDCFVHIRGNKFLQPLAAETPDVREACECVPGEDTDCPADSANVTRTRAEIYGRTSIVLDGPQIPYTATIEDNVFQSANAIATQNPVTIRNNTFLGSRHAAWTAVTLTPAADSIIENNRIETSIYVDPEVKSPRLVFSGNSCIIDAATRACAQNGVRPMSLLLSSDDAVVRGNRFPAGTKMQVSGARARITGNDMRSVPGDSAALISLSGKAASVTGNTMAIAGRRAIAVLEGAEDAVTSPNTVTLLPGNSTPVTFRWRNDDSTEAAATYKAAENAAVAGLAKNAGVRLRLGVANTGSAGEFLRKTATTLPESDGRPVSAVIDAAGGYAYFGTDAAPGRVVKVRLSDGARVGAVQLEPGEDNLTSAVIDPAKGYAYFGTYTSPGRVVRIRLSDFTREGGLTLLGEEKRLTTAGIDPFRGYAYFGTGTFGQVIKINLATFKRVAGITLAAGEDVLVSTVVDVANNIAYFGSSNTDPSHIIKIELGAGDAAPRRAAAITLKSGELNLNAGLIDASRGYAYFATGTTPAKIVKIDVNPARGFRRVGDVALDAGEDRIESGVIDALSGFAYFTDNTGGTARVIKVALGQGSNPPTRVDAVRLAEGEGSIRGGAVFNPVSGDILYGTGFAPAKVVRVSVAAKTRFRLEYAKKAASCAAATGWTQVPAATTTGPWRMFDSPRLTDGAATSDSEGLVNGLPVFSPGQVKKTASQTSPLTLGENQFTELEYAIQATANAGDAVAYCFRLTEAGDASNFTYAAYPEVIVGKPVPVCACKLDAQGRVNVREACSVMDWNDPEMSNKALATLTGCALNAPARTLYFPTGAYKTAGCQAGKVISTRAATEAFTITGDGIGKTVIEDVVVSGDAACPIDGHGGTFFHLNPGTSGVLRDMTLRQSGEGTSVAEAVRHAGPTAGAAGKLTVERVAFENWGRAVSTGVQSTLTDNTFRSKVMIGNEGGAASGTVFRDNQMEADLEVSSSSADVVVSGTACVIDPQRPSACAGAAKPSRLAIGGPRAQVFENTFGPETDVTVSGEGASIHDNTFTSAAGKVSLTMTGPRAFIRKNVFKGSGTGLLAKFDATLVETTENVFDGTGLEIAGAKGWSVYRNSFTGAGVRLVGSGNPIDMLVSLFRNTFLKLSGSGVTATAGADGLQITDNIFEGDDKGAGAVRVDATAADPNRCVVARNCFKTPKGELIEVKGCVVSENACQ